MKFQRQVWTLAAECGLRVAAGDDLALIRNEVTAGISELFACMDGGQREAEAYIVLRYESDCKELVLVLGEGQGFKKWLPVVEQYGRDIGAKTIRTHIQRAGLVRWYQIIGFSQREIVMAKTLEC